MNFGPNPFSGSKIDLNQLSFLDWLLLGFLVVGVRFTQISSETKPKASPAYRDGIDLRTQDLSTLR